MIPKSKIGDCSVCQKTNTAVRKRGKKLICLHCCQIQDNQKQTEKQINKISNPKTKINNDNIQELTIDLDRVVSRYVRLADADKNGICACFTCSAKKHFSRMQCGHFISRSHLGLRWELSNLKVQCPNCNISQNGNLIEYEKRLNSGTVEWLKEASHQVYKPTVSELKETLFAFQEKLRLVEKSKLNGY